MLSKQDDTIYYNNQFVPKSQFRVCLYDNKNNLKITNSYDEYKNMINSGIWSEEKKKEITEENSTEKKSKARK